ncbi:uncharacterized protein BDZ83DRAFT_651117 [Colletotrichum acutatum]|uniref:Uncharacterized protein n=1 Tax=Glomerella acutata TaxID=27357 RepID=A0AAD8UKM8_GLOAC|nr:uncharacterized protein BDZ83DRAFT_651117 [Colletotrichum acutatum]KAK1725691.1 hypothetical protein BDZ83DRAFT_651117 [Colletotrichum acutatum]
MSHPTGKLSPGPTAKKLSIERESLYPCWHRAANDPGAHLMVGLSGGSRHYGYARQRNKSIPAFDSCYLKELPLADSPWIRRPGIQLSQGAAWCNILGRKKQVMGGQELHPRKASSEASSPRDLDPYELGRSTGRYEFDFRSSSVDAGICIFHTDESAKALSPGTQAVVVERCLLQSGPARCGYEIY